MGNKCILNVLSKVENRLLWKVVALTEYYCSNMLSRFSNGKFQASGFIEIATVLLLSSHKTMLLCYKIFEFKSTIEQCQYTCVKCYFWSRSEPYEAHNKAFVLLPMFVEQVGNLLTDFHEILCWRIDENMSHFMCM
jgi:hypothetical protein